MGSVLDQTPPFTLYCKVDPTGHGVPVGAVILPPDTKQPAVHVLFAIVTLAGADVSVGHDGQTIGAVVPVALVLTHPVTLSIHLAKTVIALVV